MALLAAPIPPARAAHIALWPVPTQGAAFPALTQARVAANNSIEGSPARRAAFAVAGGPGAPRCLACSPSGLCATHLREKQDAKGMTAAARLAPAPSAQMPTFSGSAGARSRSPDENARGGMTQLEPLSPAERAHTLAAAGKAHSARRRIGVEVDLLISRYSSDSTSSDDDCSSTSSSTSMCLHTDWAVQRRNPRVIRKAMIRAGWFPRPGLVGEHPQWRRVLPCGTIQCVAMACSPSDCRHWDNHAALLQRLDRQARGEL